MTSYKFLTSEEIDSIAYTTRDKFEISEDQTYVDITQLAEGLNCKVYEVEFDDPDISGTVFFNEDKYVINISKSEKEERKRFTIGHELSHVILHHDELLNDSSFVDYRKPFSLYENGDDIRKEIQANMLAASLLMPAELVRKIWEETPEVELVASLFKVSRKAASVRLDSLNLLG